MPNDLLIVGMGPIGLASAYEAAKNKKKILIIEKRSESTAAIRPQVIALNPRSKAQLIAMIGQGEDLDESDISFLDSLSTSAEIKVSSVQRFILNRIKNQSKSGSIAPVEILYETTLQEGTVDLKNGEATISTNGQKQTVHFNHLVGADGSNSSTLELVNATLNDNEKIERKTPMAMQHLEGSYHLGAYVKISLKNGKELKLSEKEFASSFLENKQEGQSTENQLYFLRFDESSYKNSGRKSVKLGFIGEVPKNVFNQTQILSQEIESLNKQAENLDKEMNSNVEIQKERLKVKRQELALNYVKKAVADYLEIDENDLDVTITASKKQAAKDNLKILTFQGGSKQANKAAIQANGHGFYLIGDAYFTPNYPAGHGLNNGLEAAKLLGKIPKNSADNETPELTLHISKYNALCSNNARLACLFMQGLRWFRILGLGRILIGELLEYAVEKGEKGNKIDLKKYLSHTILVDDAKPEDVIEKFLKKIFKIHNVGVAAGSANSILPTPDPANESVPLEIDPDEDQIDKKIQEWNAFLTNNPSIVKQYRVEIANQLNALNEVLKTYKSELLKLKFKELQEDFNKVFDNHNQELINLAKNKPNKWDASGRSPLFHALQCGDLETIKAILKAGADPNKACKYSSETIFTRRVLESPEIVRELLAHGANPFKPAKSSVFILSFLANKESRNFSPKFGIECLFSLSDPNCKMQKSAVTKIAESQIITLKEMLQDKSFYEKYLDKQYIETLVERISTLKEIPKPDKREEQINLISDFVDKSLDNVLESKRGFFHFFSVFFGPSKTDRNGTEIEPQGNDKDQNLIN
ncbi:hypothetical protein [Legionella sp. PC997]|uniref:hypothetical protein n=1 Tax=Legionella sp. PC997 TaxID=2755562 RepID=UPI0015FD8332|nr:hypothetical protein [Legionella sp. PC997]QMT59470.1 hypothetical protein HBNCFIEN_00836 [Legionella sp. PC997]